MVKCLLESAVRGNLLEKGRKRQTQTLFMERASRDDKSVLNS